MPAAVLNSIFMHFLIFLIILNHFNRCEFHDCYIAEKFVAELKNPLAIEFINNNIDVLIAEQIGVIKLYNRNSKSLNIFLNLTDRVLTTNNQMEQRGLLGFTIDPNFKSNKYFYVFYSRPNQNNNNGHSNIISRFQALNINGELKGNKSSEFELLTIEQPTSSQNGGQIFFSDDGHLYITTGNGGSLKNYRFQENSLLGKILRIDVRSSGLFKNYTIPADNPYVNVSGFKPEIYAYGFRNPWRCTVDRKRINYKESNTTRIYCGDIGASERNVEDLNLIEKGGRYGWLDDPNAPCSSLQECTTLASPLPKDYHLPIHTYSHDEGQAVVGGIVYRGQQFPNLNGHFIFADYIHGSFHSLIKVNGEWRSQKLCVRYVPQVTATVVDKRRPHVIGIATNSNDEVFIMTNTEMVNSQPTGTIYKLTRMPESSGKGSTQSSLFVILSVLFLHW